MACSLERISRSASLRKISIRIRGSHRRLSLSPRPLDSGPTVSGRARLAPGDRMGCRGSPAIRSGCSSHRPPAALSYSGFDRGGESAVLALEVRRHLGALAVLLVEAHLPALTVRIVGGCAMNWAREIGSHGADNQHYRRPRIDWSNRRPRQKRVLSCRRCLRWPLEPYFEWAGWVRIRVRLRL